MFVVEGATVTAPPKTTLPPTTKFVVGFRMSVAPELTVRLLESVPLPPKVPPDFTSTLVVVILLVRLIVPELVRLVTAEFEVAFQVLVASMVNTVAVLMHPVSVAPFCRVLVIVLVLSVILLGESLSLWQIAGALCILAGIVVFASGEGEQPEKPANDEPAA